jgi:hypothetical protein
MLPEITGGSVQMDQANQVVDPRNTFEHVQTFKLFKAYLIEHISIMQHKNFDIRNYTFDSAVLFSALIWTFFCMLSTRREYY